ncbi:hypothetical protein [Salinibacter ruber]|uniref:hypothetical protein n=1 Tax=Salinibacter ruber TaxID=146919 RepID=UPI0016119D67|nr:hypothetical protein [Salinibacter ruber]MBB4062386.1 hypothetical protein [Salinibacter ruber]
MRSLKSIEENAHVTLITPRESSNRDGYLDVFDHISYVDGGVGSSDTWKSNLKFKTNLIYEKSFYEYSIFLDSDTYIIGSISSIFKLQKKFDIIIPHASVDRWNVKVKGEKLECFTPYNTGVIGFRRNEETKNLFLKWGHIYEKCIDRLPRTQPAMMRAIRESECKIYVLQNNWNARFIFPEKYTGKVRILHGREEGMQEVEEEINSYERPRVWIPLAKLCLPFPYSFRTMLSVFVKSVWWRVKNKITDLFG